ncbi:DUF4259 domain-containing protein [Streptomyces sp. SID3343]|uniref:DUF4259 domain-containing protein n=1 Tax=Streptomyces sp. SID3343 TaxID=2690260 RepID=UPI0013706801|nr:DUF4259 domain-containing protein [Streptomyces sp. SID3343]MYV99094.1 DUF4259 domain-containing protein [Streptomyces sp. SID3343]
MGTWDIDPFGNDTGADFAETLDEAPAADREDIIRSVLTSTIATEDYLDAYEGTEAVAAAALIAAQCPTGAPTDPIHGPQGPIPPLSFDLRALAVAALDRVLAEDSELADLWDETSDGPRWRRNIAHTRRVVKAQLLPPPRQDELSPS